MDGSPSRPAEAVSSEGWWSSMVILPVTPWEAALGATVTLRTLDGNVRIKVPPGSSSGRKIRLKDKGYPTGSGTRGALYAEVRIQVPDELGEEEHQLLERWAQISRFRPRREDAA